MNRCNGRTRLLLMMGIGLVGGVLIIVLEWSTLPLWHSQTRNLIAIGKWADEHREAVSRLSAQHGLKTDLFGFTGRDGLLGIRIQGGVPLPNAQQALLEMRKLIIDRRPPRSIYWIIDTGTTGTATFRLTGIDAWDTPDSLKQFQAKIESHH